MPKQIDRKMKHAPEREPWVSLKSLHRKLLNQFGVRLNLTLMLIYHEGNFISFNLGFCRKEDENGLLSILYSFFIIRKNAKQNRQKKKKKAFLGSLLIIFSAVFLMIVSSAAPTFRKWNFSIFLMHGVDNDAKKRLNPMKIYAFTF